MLVNCSKIYQATYGMYSTNFSHILKQLFFVSPNIESLEDIVRSEPYEILFLRCIGSFRNVFCCPIVEKIRNFACFYEFLYYCKKQSVTNRATQLEL
jgi:hypothetical protein